jgi:hypothetical protein
MVLINGGNLFSAREGAHNGAKYCTVFVTHVLRPGGRPAPAQAATPMFLRTSALYEPDHIGGEEDDGLVV